MSETCLGDFCAPDWVMGDKINELEFCKAFLAMHPMICINGTFFTVDGRVTDENKLKREILRGIEPYVSVGIPKKIASLLDTIRVLAYSEPLPTYNDRIFLDNGTYYLSGEFEPGKDFCMNRLPVVYNPDAPKPVRWLEFVDQLLYPEDIPTLQEYMGYCLIPSTKGQQMMFLVGKGGEGKSRVGLVMRALLGDNMGNGSIQKVETNPFARADLEHLLVMVDDDMKLEALPQTNYIKTIVTAEQPLDLERKGKQSYQGWIYSRFMVFGNGVMKSLYDRSEGFFRRQLILSVKDKDKNRYDDPYLAEKLCAEAEGILLWALEGLHRLINQNFHFTVSERTKTNREDAIRDGNNIVEFMESEGYFNFKADSQITSKDFYAIYDVWCNDNAEKPLVAKSFSSYLIQHQKAYNLEYNNNVINREKRRVWGFWGIEPIIRVFP